MSNTLVIFEPSGLRVSVEHETTILEAAREVGLHVSSDCGGRGTCGKCRVIVQPAGIPSSRDLEHLSKEEIENGVRLACTFQIKEQTRVLLLRSKGQVKILTTSESKELDIDLGQQNQYGVAIDLGTTTIVAYLLDLSTGVQFGQVESLNPQTAFGEDVISRITFASREKDGSRILQQRVITEINLQISKLVEKTRINRNQISRICIVGNTAMHHLLLAADTEPLGKAPYQPSISGPTTINSQQLGIQLRDSSEIYLPPNIAGFVGGDTVGFILSQRLDQVDDVVLGIDIGTNGEIVLSEKGKMYCCSAAAGSAFEGSTILQGMRGQSGAIEYLSINDIDDKPEISTIGGGTPLGLCGSGIVDVVAELLRTGVVNESGQMQKESKRVVDDEKHGRAYIIVKDGETPTGNRIIFTQKDVRQVQLAKAALHTGIKFLIDTVGKDVSDIDRVLLAGAFGNYIRPESAIAIGLLPKIEVSKVIPVGNAAGEGAKALLLSKKNRELVERLVTETQNIELASQERFQEVFLNSISLQ